MQLIRILLVAVSAAVLLSGASVICGSSKQDRARAIRFFVATLGAAVWTLAITVFMSLPPEAGAVAPAVVIGIIGGITLCDVSLLAYLGWEHKSGKVATVLFALVGVVLVGILALHPEVFYTDITLDHEFNRITITKGWYYVALIVYFFLISITFSSYLQRRIKSVKNPGLKTGLKVFYVGLSVGGILALIFNLVLLSAQPQLTWIGPMATSISILSFYYSVVRYRTITLSSGWMRTMSYVILVTTGVIIYALLFYAMFTALFKIPNPSPAILLLNGVTAAILLLAMPALSEIVTYMHAITAVDEIDLGYIVKKLEKTSGKNFDLREIARFLADSMHYADVILIVNGHVYSANAVNRMTIPEADQIIKAKRKEGRVWILPEELKDETVSRKREISRIGVLTDKRGREMGKVVFGKKLHRLELSRRDLIKYETVVNELAAVIEENKVK